MFSLPKPCAQKRKNHAWFAEINSLNELWWQNKIQSYVRTWTNGGIIIIVELLIPTLNKIIRNQGTYFVVIMKYHLKIIIVRGAPL